MRIFKTYYLLVIAVALHGHAVCGWTQTVIDTKNSTIRLISRSEEPNAPITGERLQCEIILRDASNQPIANYPGNALTLVSRETGRLQTLQLEGRTSPQGKLYTVYAPQDPWNNQPIRIALKAADQILDDMPRIKFTGAEEVIDQCQPLWSGPQKIYDQRVIGQLFQTGSITNITRIKLMMRPEKSDSKIPDDALKLYSWQGDYSSSVAEPPLAVSKVFNRALRDNLGEFLIDAAVKPQSLYYFEFTYVPSSTSAIDDFCLVWRVLTNPTASFPLDPYPEGMAFLSGQARPDWDLMFYIFTRTNMD